MQIGLHDMLWGEEEEKEEGQIGCGVADELDERFLDEESQRAFRGQEVHNREDGEE